MQYARRPIIRLPKSLAFILVLIIALSGCGTTATAPTAVITEPAANAKFQVGQPVTISGKVNGTNIKSIDLFINTSPYGRVDQTTVPNEFTINVKWTPDTPGPVYLSVKGLNDKGESVITSDLVSIMVEGDAPTPVPAQPTEVPAPTQPPQPTVAIVPTTAAATDAAGATVTQTLPTTPTAATVVPGAPSAQGASLVPSGEFANVRKGPGLTYDIVGKLTANQSVAVTGKSDDGAWWQINFPAAAEGKGWVNGQVVTFTGDAAKITVAKAPPPPPQPTAPPAPVVTLQVVPIVPATSAAPAPTQIPAAAALPYAQSVSFDPPNPDYGLYNAGQQVTVRWNILGATSAAIEIVGKAAPGLYPNCPSGNSGAVQPSANRTAITLPEGNLPFTINAKGYYELTIYVTKADGSQTTIPFPVSVQCYK